MAADKQHSIRQMALDLPVEPGHGEDEFVLGSANENAFAHLALWPEWPNPVTILAGPVGSGKSHLAAIFKDRNGAAFLGPDTLPAAEDLPSLGDSPVVLEDAHQIHGAVAERALFHLINHVQEKQSGLLITSRTWPESWQIALPDLRSRLRAATPMELYEPDDVLLKQVLIKLFADRQLDVDGRVLDYILVRMERSLSAAGSIVDALDRLSLERRRPITRPLAAELFS